MQVFYWIVFLVVIGIAVFAVQNSDAQLITIKFVFWKLETSLVYTILGSIGLGIIITLLFWIPREIRAAFQWKTTSKETPSPKPTRMVKRGGGAKW